MDSGLQQFLDAKWEELVPKLTNFAVYLVKSKYWNTPKASLPRGEQVEDLVYGAIEKTLQGLKTSDSGKGIRKWGPSRCDLLKFLKGVIESDIDTLLNLKEHSETGYLEPVRKVVSNEAGVEVVPSSEESSSVSVQEHFDSAMSSLYKACESDEEETLVLMAMEELSRENSDLSYEDIQAKTGLSWDQVRNAKRRIQRRVATVSGSEGGKL